MWPETKQIGIIDSVFRNFYIPPVIFGEACRSWASVALLIHLVMSAIPAVNSFEDGSETKTCIDGKQRLTSIQRSVILIPLPYINSYLVNSPHSDSWTVWYVILSYLLHYSNNLLDYRFLVGQFFCVVINTTNLPVLLLPRQRSVSLVRHTSSSTE